LTDVDQDILGVYYVHLLPAKYYSHHGWRCAAAPHNVVADGFYEVGRLKNSDQLRSLEEYGKEEVTDRRPVIVINAKPESVIIHAAYVLASVLYM